MNTTAYYRTRKHFTPALGTVYENEGSGEYVCIDNDFRYNENTAVFRNVRSGWTFTAHDVGIYEDGKIDWAYSTGGRFEK